MKKKLINVLIVLSCSACSTYHDTQSQLHETVSMIDDQQKQQWENNIQFVQQQQSLALDESFTGTIYVIATKEKLEHLQQENIMINQRKLIPVSDKESFNIRYQHQTYFTIQQIKVANVSKIEVHHSENSGIYLLFVADK